MAPTTEVTSIPILPLADKPRKLKIQPPNTPPIRFTIRPKPIPFRIFPAINPARIPIIIEPKKPIIILFIDCYIRSPEGDI